MIHLPYGTSFNENQLIAHIRASGRDYIIQGQQACSFRDHTKPSSLDYWLRAHFTTNSDIKQAENSVLDALVATSRFVIVDDLPCPDTGWNCKGIRLI